MSSLFSMPAAIYTSQSPFGARAGRAAQHAAWSMQSWRMSPRRYRAYTYKGKKYYKYFNTYKGSRF